MLNIILLLTSSCFYYLYKIINNKLLRTNILLVFLSSQLFWSNPVKGCLYHKIDAFLVRLLGFNIILHSYLIIKKSTKRFILFLLTLFLFLLIILYSDYYSYLNWCNNKHIFIHIFVHLYAILIMIFFI
jgi:hypothetical protein